MSPRLKARADALDRLRASIDGSFGDESDAGQALREASALIRSLSDVEPFAWCSTGNKGQLLLAPHVHGFAPNEQWSPLYLHPAEHSGSVPQAPAEGVEALRVLQELLGELVHEYGTRKVGHWFPEASALVARSNVTGPGTSQATPGPDEKSTREGVERDAARYRELVSRADWDNEYGNGAWTITIRDPDGMDFESAIDAQIKTGEAPK